MRENAGKVTLRPGVVSIIVATYDRPSTLRRALDSVFGQDSPDWELIVVDDGQREGTAEALSHYADPRMTVLRHDRNRGTSAARNTGLDHVTGEWFTLLDDDDEMLPQAVSTLTRVAREHPDVDAITCNCIDSVTGQFSGSGLDASQYVDFPTTYRRFRGEHWGITKTELLRGRHFAEGTTGGFEGVLWLKLSAEAHRYYLHEGLRIFHTEGDDRITKSLAAMDLRRRMALYLPLAEDAEYRSLLHAYNPGGYAAVTFCLALALIAAHRRGEAWAYCRDYRGPNLRRMFLLSAWAFGPRWITFASRIHERVSRRKRWTTG